MGFKIDNIDYLPELYANNKVPSPTKEVSDLFTVWDLDFNEVPLPKDEMGYGLTGVDIFVSSVRQEVQSQTGARRPGNIPTGYRDVDRDVSLEAHIHSMNSTDYRMKRDEVFNFFSSLGTFYISESQQGNKLLKVRVVDSYTPDRPEEFQKFATVNIPLYIVGAPYWVSRKTSMDLHRAEGIPIDGGWSFGMGIVPTPDRLMYSYTDERRFSIYNPGKDLNTILEKGDCFIRIYVQEDVLSFSLEDETGNRLVYNPEKDASKTIYKGYSLTLDGHDIGVVGVVTEDLGNRLDRTNRYYPVILHGNNRFVIRGMTKFTATFDFRFKYY